MINERAGELASRRAAERDRRAAAKGASLDKVPAIRPTPEWREAMARLKAMIAEAKDDPEKLALYFGKFDTSEENQ
jgi:hypothetical protein